jgi:serine/threonine-protein kinase
MEDAKRPGGTSIPGGDATLVGRAQEAPAVPDELPIGTRVGEYIVVGLLGIGGCGVVYRAAHRVLARPSALKVLDRQLAQSAEMVERFVLEARAANLIRHPNIVDIWDFGRLSDGRPYFVMELLDGVNLEQLLMRQGSLTPAEALELLEPVCGALHAAHEAGIIHRDLKAGNIVVVQQGSRRTVKLLDFGIAKLTHVDPSSTGLTSVGRRLGTPSSMAPEQIRGGPVDRRTDVYALGVLLFNVLTGRYPFEAHDPLEVERMHLEAAPPRPSERVGVAPEIDAIVLRCLEKDPEQRYPTTEAFLKALRDAVGAMPRRRSSSSGHSVGRSGPAIGVFVEVRVDDSDEHLDDELLDLISHVLDLSAQQLVDAGMTLSLQTGTAALAARLLPAEPAAERAERARILECALALRRRAVDQIGEDLRVHINVAVHVDKAMVRTGVSGGDEIVGGRIVSVGAWMPEQNITGVCATLDAIADLPVEPSGRTGTHVVLG